MLHYSLKVLYKGRSVNVPRCYLLAFPLLSSLPIWLSADAVQEGHLQLEARPAASVSFADIGALFDFNMARLNVYINQNNTQDSYSTLNYLVMITLRRLTKTTNH